jgi:hypothetical protein
MRKLTLLLLFLCLVVGIESRTNSVLANDLVAQDTPCVPIAAQMRELDASVGEISPIVLPAGPAIDDDWPIVRQWTETQINETGMVVTITYTLRRNPDLPSESETQPAATSCTFAANESLQNTNTVQGVTQYLTSYFYRYNWVDGGQSYKAYWIYETREYWTRTSTSYTLGQNATAWTYNGWNCDNAYSTNGANHGFTPQWHTSTRTYDYVYDFTKNWITKTPGPNISSGLIKTYETTPAYNNGNPIGTLATEVRLWGQ